ncbi:MAG: hypothetical protein MPK06_02070 [Alphaproteobacteria bacterium]|nr:hypothetical protein [Alphaproteobacteria bacterium]MDA8003352.1 hypothetical protein [Alphaproteobacteria bacterium]MDA8005314.1 hypothetical protein [Alphaproteobacteria bacterium]MDA8012737.1 hypothetical protein [Alphaproteobacteria bacterium]
MSFLFVAFAEFRADRAYQFGYQFVRDHAISDDVSLFDARFVRDFDNARIDDAAEDSSVADDIRFA